ncbi:hypothetical protein [Roseovarius aestuarii]|uniref:Uncharacterized protein n=1 Tax=Roseovarius aestuarii TaxID=475083 RepID=A0A1X7BUB2_9RHOB|nr:hypothetical protein [Roseovarius aestuarii]SMC13198.1 hypothetical protein ROA7745_03039 [Roseovarius aestuarii]
MIVLLGAILGVVTGATIAWRRKGRLADILQYAFVYFLIFSLAGLFVTLLIHRAAAV